MEASSYVVRTVVAPLCPSILTGAFRLVYTLFSGDPKSSACQALGHPTASHRVTGGLRVRGSTLRLSVPGKQW